MARAGDEGAFGELVREYQHMIHALTYRMTGSDPDAADLAQDTFVKAWQRLDTFRGDRLWVSGPCYLLILDLPTRSVVRRCMMNNTTVQQLQIAGDTVWGRMNRAIYRFPRQLAN